MSSVMEKASRVRLLICDVDGVLTNGNIWFDEQEHKTFHCHDGMGFRLLEQAGLQMAIISSRNSEVVAQRMKELNVPAAHVLQGQKNKVTAYHALRDSLKLKDREVAYVGDDLPDLAVMRLVGLPIAVANASEPVKRISQWQTKKNGGEGAVREACELLLSAQNKLESIHSLY